MDKTLKEYETFELVEELKQREGVEAHWAEPHVNNEMNITGPALVLIIID